MQAAEKALVFVGLFHVGVYLLLKRQFHADTHALYTLCCIVSVSLPPAFGSFIFLVSLVFGTTGMQSPLRHRCMGEHTCSIAHTLPAG